MRGKHWYVLALMLSAGAISLAAAQQTRTLVVFAASSLTQAFEVIGADFEAANPGVDVLFSFASSAELAAQLAEGAPADVLASANARQMSAAQDAGRTAGEPATFARNRLALIVPADNPAGIGGLADLAAPGVALVIAAEGVPARDYTELLLERLAADDGYGPQYVDAVRANVVSEEPNVRQAAAKVALGEADAGIVYASDVTPDLRDAVRVFAIPAGLNVAAEYPIAVVAGSGEPALAQSFIDAVLSEAGQGTLAEWGFARAAPRRVCFFVFFPVCFG